MSYIRSLIAFEHGGQLHESRWYVIGTGPIPGSNGEDVWSFMGPPESTGLGSDNKTLRELQEIQSYGNFASIRGYTKSDEANQELVRRIVSVIIQEESTGKECRGRIYGDMPEEQIGEPLYILRERDEEAAG